MTETKKEKPKLGARPTLSKKKIIAALGKVNGKPMLAAKVLGCHPSALFRWIARHKDLEEYRDELREKWGDYVESKLEKLVKAGNLGAIIFTLKTQYKKRGWTEKYEVSVDGGIVLELKPAPMPEENQRLVRHPETNGSTAKANLN